MASLLVAALATGCAVSGLNEVSPGAERKVRWSGPFSLVPPRLSWTAQPSALVLAARQPSNGREQLMGLSNDTTLPGDNFMLLVAYGSPTKAPKRLRLSSFRDRLGGVPAPFKSLADGALRRSRDNLGTYFYKADVSGAATNCVLAIRRLDLSSRILPEGTAVMEVILRNCVEGSVEDALRPFSPENLAVTGDPPPESEAGKPRVFSPLAAPEF